MWNWRSICSFWSPLSSSFLLFEFCRRFCLHWISQIVLLWSQFLLEIYSLPIPDMDAYSQNFQFAAKSFFGCQYCNFVNLYLKLGVETQEGIILIIFGGRPCKSVNGFVLLLVAHKSNFRVRALLPEVLTSTVPKSRVFETSYMCAGLWLRFSNCSWC